MQHSTKTKAQDLLNTQSNTEKTHKGESLIERRKVEGTPFHIIKHEEGFFIAMGKFRLTKETETEEETLSKLETEKWDIIGRMIIGTLATMEEIDKTITEKLQTDQE